MHPFEVGCPFRQFMNENRQQLQLLAVLLYRLEPSLNAEITSPMTASTRESNSKSLMCITSLSFCGAGGRFTHQSGTFLLDRSITEKRFHCNLLFTNVSHPGHTLFITSWYDDIVVKDKCV